MHYDTTVNEEYMPSLYQGTLYYTHAAGAHSLFLDVPFTADTTNGFSLLSPLAQAYINFGLSESVNLKVGQFDAVLGFEPSDTKDLIFTRSGLIANSMIPGNHAGFLLEKSFNKLTFTAIVATPAGKTIMDSGADLSFAVGYGDDESPYSVSVGAYQGAADDNALWNVLAGLVISETQSLDAEFDIGGKSTDSIGTLVQYTHSVDTWAAALRAEYLKDVGGKSTQCGGTIGINKTLNDALKLKADYGMVVTKVTKDADSETTHNVGLGAIYSF